MNRTLSNLLLAAALALSLPAIASAADKPVTPDKKAKEADLGKKADAGGPGKELAGDVSRKKKGKEEVRAALEYDQFRYQIEGILKEKRRELMRTLAQMAKLNNDPKEKPDLLMRLGDLEWQESKYWFFEANRQDEKSIHCKQKGDSGCVSSAEAEKKEFFRKRDEYQALAIDHYKEVIKKFPDFKRIDEVLFFLAQLLHEKGDIKESLKAFEILIKRFPKSIYVADAYLAFGEFYFNSSGGKKENVQKALEAYTRAASHTESKVYGFAIYKQGWCHYNLADYPNAADKFKATIFYGDIATNVGEDKKTALVKEARKDFVLTYSHFGDPTQAKEEFKKVGGDENWWTMLKGLAGLYYDDGKDKEAVLVYRQLIKEKPISPEAPFYQGRIVDAVMRVGNKKITVEQARLLVKIFQDVEKSGVIKEEKDKQSLKEARELAERTLSNLAVIWHNEGKKTRDEETFVFANEAYNDYLSIYPDSAKSYDLRFYHAELLFENLQKYEQAAEEYTRVVNMDIDLIEKQKKKPGKWLVKATEGAIFSYDEVVKKFEEKEDKAAAKDPKKQLPIPAPKQALLTACENYLKYVPTGEKKVQVSYKAAQVYYRYNYFDEAVKRFAVISLEHPEDELAVFSANLVLDVYNILDDNDKIDEWARKFLAEPKLGKPEFKAELTRMIEKNAFKLAEKVEQKGQFVAAGEKYVAFVNEFPKSELADEALFNASVNFHKARKIEEAVKMRDEIVNKYPNSNLAPQALYLNASQYEDIGEFERAANYYEVYASRYEDQKGGKKGKGKAAPPPKTAKKDDKKKGDKKDEKAEEKKDADDKGSGEYEEEKAKTALFNAGVFREGLKDYRGALKNREKYLSLWPDDADTEAIFLSIADLHEKNSANAAALKQLEAYTKKYNRDANKVLGVQYRIIKIYEKQSQRAAARKMYERAWEYYKKLPAKQKGGLSVDPGGGMEPIAWAHYYLSEKTFGEFDKIKLRLPEKAMAQALKDKGKKLLEVQKRYTETVGFKVAGPAICALQKIGMAYRGFAKSLYDAPVPPGLPEEVVDAYKQALAEQATPVEAKATEAFANAVQKAREFDVFNDCSKEAFVILQTSASDRFPEIVEQAARPKEAPAPPKQAAAILTSVQPVPKAAVPDENAAKIANEKIPPKRLGMGGSGDGDLPPPGPGPAAKKKEEPPGYRSPTAPVDEAPIKKKKGSEPTDDDLL